MYRSLFGLVLTLTAALLLAALSFSASTSGRASVRYISGPEPETLDPHQLGGQTGGRIVTAMFEGLTRYEAKSLAPAPGAAESWEISPDGLRYTFQLRKGNRWSDGMKLDAADFVYSWRRILAPELGAKYAYLLHPIKGARALNTYEALAQTIEQRLRPALAEALEQTGPSGLSAATWRALLGRLPFHDSLQHSRDAELRQLLDQPLSEPALPRERLARFLDSASSEVLRLRQEALDAKSRFGESLGIHAEGPDRFVVELDAPTPYFLDITSFYPTLPVPRHVVEKNPNTWFLPETVVGNGPFLLEAWRVNDRIRLRRNDRYWGRSEIRAESIDALPMENANTALNLYLTGAADWLPTWYPTDLVSELRKRPDFYAHAAFTIYYYRFNTKRAPLNDARVRQAINLAIDRPVIVEQVLGLGQLPAGHFVPPGMPGYEAPVSPIRLDVARARQLLSDAGFPEGRGFPGIGILYNTQEAHKKIAEVIANQLQNNLGISVTPYNQEWQSYLETLRAGNYELGRGTWIGDYLDPNTFLDMWVTNGGNNQTGFSSPIYDALIRAAANMDQFAENAAALLGQLKNPERITRELAARAVSQDPDERRACLARARMALLGEAEAILVQDEFPILPVYFTVNSGLRAPGLRGLHTELELADGRRVPNLPDIYPLRELWLDPSVGPQ